MKKTKATPAALGFRVKSGWAMAVLLAYADNFPTLIQCAPALLSDPQFPATKQPYHAALELPPKEAKATVQKLVKLVSAAAKRSAKDLLEQAEEAGYQVRGAAMVVGSLVDPASLHNEHIRAHGLEGQLFRTVLADAFEARDIRCSVFLEKEAYACAAEELNTTEETARRTVARIGESHEGSWRAEEKLAALAAWIALAGARSR
jgi:hypothetical protein